MSLLLLLSLELLLLLLPLLLLLRLVLGRVGREGAPSLRLEPASRGAGGRDITSLVAGAGTGCSNRQLDPRVQRPRTASRHASLL